MELRGKSAALYGRFSPGGRERIAGAIARAGGAVARDLTRRSHFLVIGAMAAPLIPGGHLTARLAGARGRGLPVFSERFLNETLNGRPATPATLPLANLQTNFTTDEIALFAAFDIVRVENGKCRFGDAQTLKTAAEIIAAGRSLAEAVQILARLRDLAPKGRHKVVLTPKGAALQWDQGQTTLEGQGLLPLDESVATVEDLFEAAELAEDEGDLDRAAHLYDMAARADREDAIALYNLGNVRLHAERYDEAALAYQRALARDPSFVEARYNLAEASEASGKIDQARQALVGVLEAAPDYADALFNLARLDVKRGDVAAAKAGYEAYLRTKPPEDWAAKARKAIMYCTAKLAS